MTLHIHNLACDVRPDPQLAPRPLTRDLDAIYAGIAAAEATEAGHPLEPAQVRWVVEEAQRRTARVLGRACVLSGRVRS
jgi:hypothetical protein